MKKLIFFCAALFVTHSSLAQGSAEDASLKIYRVDVAAGLYTSKDLFSSIQFENPTPWGRNARPTYFASVSFYRQRKIEVGVALGYQNPQLDDPIVVSNGPNPATGRLDLQYYTLMPQIRFNWVRSKDELFELYSIAGFALTFVSERYSNDVSTNSFYPIPGIHLTGLGLRFGKTVGGFMEMGFGSKGVMSAGISMRL